MLKSQWWAVWGLWGCYWFVDSPSSKPGGSRCACIKKRIPMDIYLRRTATWLGNSKMERSRPQGVCTESYCKFLKYFCKALWAANQFSQHRVGLTAYVFTFWKARKIEITDARAGNPPNISTLLHNKQSWTSLTFNTLDLRNLQCWVFGCTQMLS